MALGCERRLSTPTEAGTGARSRHSPDPPYPWSGSALVVWDDDPLRPSGLGMSAAADHQHPAEDRRLPALRRGNRALAGSFTDLRSRAGLTRRLPSPPVGRVPDRLRTGKASAGPWRITAVVVVLGIDPGTAHTGYGVVLSGEASSPRSTAA